VYASRLIGAETSLVVWGGGNTSIKLAERDYRGREVRVLRVKGSGSDLKSIEKKHFPGVRMDDVLALLERQDMGDQEMVDYLAHALQEPASPRPSIETLLHGFLPAEAVIHTHADAIVSLTNNDRAADVLREVYGAEVIALPYRRPGFLISREVAETFERHPKAKALLLEKHGTICWGATVKEAYLSTVELISRAEEAIGHRAKGRVRFGGVAMPAASPDERRKVALAVAPALRGLVGRERRVIMAFDDAPDVLEFACSKEAATLSTIGPATPDHTIYTKRLPCFAAVDNPRDPVGVAAAIKTAVERFVDDYTAYVKKGGGSAPTDAFPRVITVAGLGMFTTGKDRRTAGIVSDIYHHTISVLGAATSFGAYVSLSAQEAFDVEYWPLELYKLSQAPPEKELARRIVLVTGGASGIGRAAALRLAAVGAHVVVGDLDAAGARKVADEVVAAVGPARAIGLGMDVASETSVRAAFEEAVLAYGGLDIVVSNAGIAHSSPVDQMTLADWERSFAVNSTGHFLVAREGMRVLKAQGLGGAFVFVATKNVMSPGKDFAAYSAAKAAEAQLAKVLALEGGPHGIRSNIVNPDAVFRDSKLWSEDVRRERARAQGISVEQLEDFYRKRNILAAPILPEDVAEAVLFLASERSAKTTGCTITVDGGVKDAFPR
jgi:rhamnulose-1-phosphate aldolase/alcohol dehydrogenase